jgi:hypothetical protein
MTDKKTTIFRRAKDRENPYVMIDRTFFENTTLSWKAKGLMGYLLSRPNDWTVIQADLVNRSTDGVHATRAGIAELIKAGHLTRHTIRNPDGTIKEHEIQIHEIPVPVAQRTIPRKNKKQPASQQPALPLEPESGFQHVVNQHVDKQHEDNRTLLSTDVLSTDLTKKPHAPTGAVSGTQSDIELFYDGDVPEHEPESKPPVMEKRDVVTDIFQGALKRKEDPLHFLKPGTPCGDHSYLEPYQTFCAVIQRDPSTVGERKTLTWLRQFEKIADVGGCTVPPGTLAKAIWSIRDDWSFEHKKWTSPFCKGFIETVELTAAQIEVNGEQQGPSALEKAGYDVAALTAAVQRMAAADD